MVLIVSEDYAHIRQLLKEMGYSTAGMPDPESAREIFNAMRPALVIVDYALASQGRRSLSYFVRIMSRYPRTPLLAIIERTASEARQALAEDFDDVCSRPIVPDVLRAKVRRLAGRSNEDGSEEGVIASPLRPEPGTS